MVFNFIYSNFLSCMAMFQGRVAKCAFGDPEAYSQMCFMPEDLVRDYSYLLMAFTCADDIDPISYQMRANDWLQRFHSSQFCWNWPSVTVHCILGNSKQYDTQHIFRIHCKTILQVSYSLLSPLFRTWWTRLRGVTSQSRTPWRGSLRM